MLEISFAFLRSRKVVSKDVEGSKLARKLLASTSDLLCRARRSRGVEVRRTSGFAISSERLGSWAALTCRLLDFGGKSIPRNCQSSSEVNWASSTVVFAP